MDKYKGVGQQNAYQNNQVVITKKRDGTPDNEITNVARSAVLQRAENPPATRKVKAKKDETWTATVAPGEQGMPELHLKKRSNEESSQNAKRMKRAVEAQEDGVNNNNQAQQIDLPGEIQKEEIESDIRTKVMRTGKRYIGEFKGAKPEGFGKWIYPNRDVYIGETKGGKREGMGTMIYLNGTRCTGEWVNDKLEGIGTLKKPNGQVETGESKKGEFTGIGTIRCQNGKLDTGEVKKGKIEGIATLRSEDGKIYTGETERGRWQGIGTIRGLDKTIRTGEMNDGSVQGIATMKDQHGHIETGERKDGKWNGIGTTIHEDLGVFTGELKDGKIEGIATTRNRQGKTVTGERKDGEWNGIGTTFYQAIGVITGEMDNGKTHGIATHRLLDGRILTGQGVGGEKAQGIRTVACPNGKIVTGGEGVGAIKRADGSLYVGEIKEPGQGVFGISKEINGAIYTGNWKSVQQEPENTIALEGYAGVKYPDGTTMKGVFSNGKKQGDFEVIAPGGMVSTKKFDDDKEVELGS